MRRLAYLEQAEGPASTAATIKASPVQQDRTPSAVPEGWRFNANHLFTRVAERVAGFAGKPSAFVVAALLIALWLVTGPIFHYSDTWQLVVNTATTVVTFLMVFLIQNSQNRDAAAMQAKLDEVIRASRIARNQFIVIEHRTDQEIERIRAELERECEVAGSPVGAATSVAHLRRRR